MIKIEFTDEKVFERTVNAKDGRSFTFRTQNAHAHIEGEPYPRPFYFQLYDRPAFKPGLYFLTTKNFKIDKYQNLGLSKSLDLASEIK